VTFPVIVACCHREIYCSEIGSIILKHDVLSPNLLFSLTCSHLPSKSDSSICNFNKQAARSTEGAERKYGMKEKMKRNERRKKNNKECISSCCEQKPKGRKERKL
jgi:hypothetical protein